MLKRLSATLAALCAVFSLAAPAEALQFSSSSTTGTGGVIVPFRIATPNIGPIGAELGIRFIPGLSSFLGPAVLHPGYKEISSSLIDAEANLSYNWQLADINFLGRFNPTISPYLGYRYLGSPTTEGALSLEAQGLAVNYSQLGGINYGVKATTELPLGFALHAKGGLTTLISGGWDSRVNSTSVTSANKMAVNGTTLPTFGVGASWGLLNVVNVYVGYDLSTLPTGLRGQGMSLSGGQSTISSLNVGLQFLFFSI
jgi:hypothetical protein